MRDGWVETTLAEIAEIKQGTRVDHKPLKELEFPVLGATGIVGSWSQFTYSDPRIALGCRGTVGTVRLISRPCWFGNNVIAIWPKDSTRIDIKFLALALERADLVAQGAIGGQVQKQITRTSLGPVTIQFPPLMEQLRVVDLVSATDAVIVEAQGQVTAARRVLDNIRRIGLGAESVDLGDLCVMRSGPSFKAADVLAQPEHGAVPLLGIPNTPASGQLNLDSISYVRGVPASALRLDESSLVLIRTNGNRSRIGNIYRADQRTVGFVVSAFQIALVPNDPADSAFLYWYLGSPNVQAEISASASGSTGLGNVAVSWLKSLQIPQLSAEEVSAYVDRCEAAGATLAALEGELSALRKLRENLLTSLLSGEHEIPAAYDEFLVETQ